MCGRDATVTQINVVHEEFRNPSMYYCSKDVCMEAPWQSRAVPASQIWRASGKAMTVGTLVAGAAAVAALGCAALRKR